MSETIPMVVYSVFQPFVDALRAGQKDVGSLLLSAGFPDEAISADTLVPVQAWYDFAELTAQALEDRHAGFKIGFQQSITTMADAGSLAFANATLGEILSTLVIDFRRIGNYSAYKLTTDGHWAAIEAKRKFKPTSRPVQIDGYSMGHMAQIVGRFAGYKWDRTKFRVSVVEPHAIPSNVIPPSAVSGASAKGASIRFPADWLLFCQGGNRRQEANQAASVSNGFINDAQRVIELHMADPNFKLEDLSKRVSKSPATLRRLFSQNRTSFKQELDRLRIGSAQKLLKETDVEISIIGAAIGYPNSSSFARAFRKTSGMTPSEFRRVG